MIVLVERIRILEYNSTFQLHSASTHGSELAYVFGIPLYNAWDTFYMAKFNRQDETVSRAVMTYWTNFAKTGNPNPRGEDAWAPFNAQSLSTRVINTDPSTVAGVRKRILEILASRQPL